MSRSDPITERSVNGLFYQLTDILYNSHNTRVYIGHVIDVPKNKYAIKRPIPLGRKLQVMKEAGSLSKIMHPNVARYIDHSEHHIEPYIVMEFVSDNFERLISSNRIKKFCSNSIINTNKLEMYNIKPPIPLHSSIKRTIQFEFDKKFD